MITVEWAKYLRPTIGDKAVSAELVGREYLAHPTVTVDLYLVRPHNFDQRQLPWHFSPAD